MTVPTDDVQPRDVHLDALRGVAAVTVMLGHAYLQGTLAAFGEIGDLTHVGYAMALAVRCFFVLSGFLLMRGVLADREARPAGWSSRYAIRRVARIWPLYAVGGVFMASVAYWRGWLNLPVLVQYFTFTQNYALRAPLLGPAWTIGCEILYYAMLPALVVWVSRRRSLRVQVAGPILAGLAALGVRPLLSKLGHDGGRLVLGLVVLDLLIVFMAGVALALYRRARPRAGSGSPWAVPAALAALLLLVLLGPVGPDRLWDVASAVSLVVLVDADRLRNRALAWLGAISYGVYLLHIPTGAVVTSWSFGLSGPARLVTSVVAVVAATLGLAALAHRWIELPAIAWARRRTQAPRAERETARTPAPPTASMPTAGLGRGTR